MKNSEKKITLVSMDDWEGLYIDGVLVYETHSIGVHTFAKYAGIELEEIEADADLVEDRLPKNLSEFKAKLAKHHKLEAAQKAYDAALAAVQAAPADLSEQAFMKLQDVRNAAALTLRRAQADAKP